MIVDEEPEKESDPYITKLSQYDPNPQTFLPILHSQPTFQDYSHTSSESSFYQPYSMGEGHDGIYYGASSDSDSTSHNKIRRRDWNENFQSILAKENSLEKYRELKK